MKKNSKRPPAIRPVKSGDRLGDRLGGRLAQGRSGRPAPAPQAAPDTRRHLATIRELKDAIAAYRNEGVIAGARAAKAAKADRDYRETILADALHVSILEAVDQLRPGMPIWGRNTVTARIRALLHFWPVDPNSDATKPETHYVATLVGGGTTDDAP